MGFHYSLCLVTRREVSESLLEKLSELLDSESRDRIGSKRWSPESEVRRMTVLGTSDIDARGIAGMQVTDSGASNFYCLSLHIQLERELEPLVADHRLKCFERPGSFGCMWTSVFAGERYVLLQMNAATSAMSQVLEQSQAIHTAWIELAQKTHALFAYIDLEDKIAIQLFPTYGDLRLPDSETLAYEGDYQFSVDRMVEFLLRTTSD